MKRIIITLTLFINVTIGVYAQTAKKMEDETLLRQDAGGHR